MATTNKSASQSSQDAEAVRETLEKRIVALDEERRKLVEREARFKDFAEASADFFWETDASLNVRLISEEFEHFHFAKLTDCSNTCHSHTSNEVLKLLQAHEQLSDIVVYSGDEEDYTYLRISGKPVLDAQGRFVGYRGVGRDVTATISSNQRVEFLATHENGRKSKYYCCSLIWTISRWSTTRLAKMLVINCWYKRLSGYLNEQERQIYYVAWATMSLLC